MFNLITFSGANRTWFLTIFSERFSSLLVHLCHLIFIEKINLWLSVDFRHMLLAILFVDESFSCFFNSFLRKIVFSQYLINSVNFFRENLLVFTDFICSTQGGIYLWFLVLSCSNVAVVHAFSTVCFLDVTRYPLAFFMLSLRLKRI